MSWRYDNDSATIARLVEETNAAFADTGVGVTVLAGAEIAMTRAADLAAEELSALTLGGGPWLLIECPFTSVAIGLDTLILELEEPGHRIVLAHPERCPAFHRDPRMLESLVRGGVLTSITAGSLVGRFGGTVKRFALGLLDAELVHNVASDAHDPEQRRPGMAEELREAGLGGLAEWLTEACRRRSSPASRASRRVRARPSTRVGRPARGTVVAARARSGELRDRHDHPDQDEHDDRDLHPDPGWRHGSATAYFGRSASSLRGGP